MDLIAWWVVIFHRLTVSAGSIRQCRFMEKMGQVLAQGTISLRKAKAHVSNHVQQCQYLTDGNCRADALAKSCAKEKLRVKIACFCDLISQAVGLQVHLVTTLMSRTEHFAHDDLELFNSPVYGLRRRALVYPYVACGQKNQRAQARAAFFRR